MTAFVAFLILLVLIVQFGWVPWWVALIGGWLIVGATLQVLNPPNAAEIFYRRGG
jgi:hypothetical protein